MSLEMSTYAVTAETYHETFITKMTIDLWVFVIVMCRLRCVARVLAQSSSNHATIR